MRERFERFVIEWSAHSHHVNFVVKEIVAAGHPDKEWYYESRDNMNDQTTNFSDAAEFLSGSIKRNGCSDWNFHTDSHMMHFCGRGMAESLGHLMSRLYNIAAQSMDGWDGDHGHTDMGDDVYGRIEDQKCAG